MGPTFKGPTRGLTDEEVKALNYQVGPDHQAVPRFRYQYAQTLWKNRVALELPRTQRRNIRACNSQAEEVRAKLQGDLELHGHHVEQAVNHVACITEYVFYLNQPLSSFIQTAVHHVNGVVPRTVQQVQHKVQEDMVTRHDIKSRPASTTCTAAPSVHPADPASNTPRPAANMDAWAGQVYQSGVCRAEEL